MALWRPEQLETVDAVLTAVRTGQPAALVIEGAAGTGKSTLLDEVVRHADGFQVLIAAGVEGNLTPFGILGQWGAVTAPAGESDVIEPFLAAQLLRELADDLAAAGPLLLMLDDAHWADAESVEALGWLLRRASGDRLLVVAAGRPRVPDDGAPWRQWASAEHAQRMTLSGLSEQDAVALARERASRLSVEAARRLWQHTGGNPLYLTALLDEYSADELTQANVLPAPTEFAQVVARRLQRLPDSCLSLVRAVAVLGSTWTSLLDATALADVTEVTNSTEVLRRAGLIEVHNVDADPAVRVSHALTRASIYQQIPEALRRQLHARAASLVSDRSTALDHRVAAAAGYDDHLAEELADYAAQMRERRAYRVAAQYLRCAAAVTSSPTRREARWLDSLFDLLLAHQFSTVRAELAEVRKASDPMRRALLLGATPVLQGHWREGIRILAAAAGAAAGARTNAGDALTRYRIEALLAWARILTDGDTRLVDAGLARLANLPVEDPATADLAAMAHGHARARTSGLAAVVEQFASLPDQPVTVAGESSLLLAWRGVVNMHSGDLPAAIGDLREAQRRLQNGQFADVMNGGVHGVLGMCYWLHGQWDLATICLRLAVEIPQEIVLPMVYVERALLPAGLGDLEEADRLLAEATAMLREVRWREAIQALMLARVVRAHAGGSSSEQAALLDELTEQWPDTPFDTGVIGPVWLMHLALAQIWAGRLHQAAATVAAMLTGPTPPVAVAAAAWLRALIAQARGDHRAAMTMLKQALAGDAEDLPLYRGHMLVDNARLLTADGQKKAAARALAEAEAIYSRIGATTYAQRVARLRAGANGEHTPAHPAAGTPNPFRLSDRERDVAALILSGLSYSQVARELFITQSTVGYHLSNIYAKTGVNSRHELTALARKDPHHLGLSSLSP